MSAAGHDEWNGMWLADALPLGFTNKTLEYDRNGAILMIPVMVMTMAMMMMAVVVVVVVEVLVI